MQKKHNFSAGPSILPAEVIQQAAEALLNFNQTGLSLIEVSHRGKDFVAVMEKARSLVKELLQLNDDYEVLFLQGGASLGFLKVPMNFMKVNNGNAGYIETGVWAQNAIKEAQLFGKVNIIASSKDRNFSYVPENYTIPEDLDYLHITSNNTIYGTQMQSFPQSTVPLICDMSSDIFSRVFNAQDFAMIYAGAQKNMGPAGTTLYIVNKNFLGKTGRQIPTMLDLSVHIKKDSMFNTPPVFAVYTSMLTLEWLKKIGGVAAIEKINREKARILYEEIDRNSLFKGLAEPNSRSIMNVTFILTRPQLEDEFNRLWQEAGIVGLKGHRVLGGYRASIYNAMPIESVKVLIEVMQHFEKIKG